jgi:uncharacterized protein
MDFDRRHVLTALAAGGVVAASTLSAEAAPKLLPFADMKKGTDIACLYHCDFGNDKRYSAMLRNINNHLSAYDFDPFKIKIVIVAHSAGIKYHLKTLEGTPWAKQKIDPELGKRMEALSKYGVEVYLCQITFKSHKISFDQAKDASYIRLVPSGVGTVGQLQAKGYGYLKVG